MHVAGMRLPTTLPCRVRCSREGKGYGISLVLVGAAATAYHAASGRLRRHLRKLDYWTISLASTRLLDALAPAGCRRPMLQAGSWALTPFRPTAVSTLNFALAEVCRCLPCALRKPPSFANNVLLL